MAFGFRQSLTVDHTQCGATDSSSFPVLVSGTYNGTGGIADLRVTGSGGKIQHTVSSNGVTIPADLAFYSDSGLTSALPFEVASYTSTTGVIEAYVQVSTLSHTVDTVFYMGYGDAGQTTDLSGFGSGTKPWDANFMAVYHFGDGSTLSLKDSTANANHLTNTTTNSATSGIAGGAVQFVATNYLSTTSNFTALGGTAVTMEAWLNGTSAQYSTTAGIIAKGPVNAKWEFYFDSAAGHGGKPDLRGGSNASTVNATTAPTGSAWNYLVATLNGTSGAQFLNNAANGSGTVTTLNDGAASVFLNGLDASNYHGYAGKMDEARISNVVRGADWQTATYNNIHSASTFVTNGSETAVSTFLAASPKILSQAVKRSAVY